MASLADKIHSACYGEETCRRVVGLLPWKQKSPAALQMCGNNCLSITVIVLCTIHFHPWLHENDTSAPEPGDTDWNRYTGTETSEGRQWAEAASDWYVVSNQQSFIDQATDQWQDCFNACLKVKSKHWTFAMMCLSITVMTLRRTTLLLLWTNWLMFSITR